MKTPMTKTPTTGPTGLFSRLIRVDLPESTKRYLAVTAGWTLCACSLLLTMAILWQAYQFRAVDSQLVWAAVTAYAVVAGLAGVAYRKPEQPKKESK